jgi:hypothetical protein
MRLGQALGSGFPPVYLPMRGIDMSRLRDQRSGVTWTNALVLYGSAASDYFGYALAISNDYHLAISAYGSQGQRVGEVSHFSAYQSMERS